MNMEVSKICQTCLGLDCKLFSIYKTKSFVNLGYVSDILVELTNIPQSKSDGLPGNICFECITEINRFYSFKLRCRNYYDVLTQIFGTKKEPQLKSYKEIFHKKKNLDTELGSFDMMVESVDLEIENDDLLDADFWLSLQVEDIKMEESQSVYKREDFLKETSTHKTKPAKLLENANSEAFSEEPNDDSQIVDYVMIPNNDIRQESLLKNNNFISSHLDKHNNKDNDFVSLTEREQTGRKFLCEKSGEDFYSSTDADNLIIEVDDDSEETIRKTQISFGRHLRDITNPLELQEKIFQQKYRVSKPVFCYLLDVLKNSLPKTKKKHCIPPIVKLSACLLFFAEASNQKGVGKNYGCGLSQSTFCEVLSEVLAIFEYTICPSWINYQLNAEKKRRIQLSFYEKNKIPGVIGCIDGTHIRITAPRENKLLYFCKKGYFCLNVLVVCDDQMRITYVDATHPGASTDSVVWNESELRSWMEQQYLNGEENMCLLGDASFPLEPWLLTPHRTPKMRTFESKFNDAHSKTRSMIDITIGVLKNRWRCLLGTRELYYQPKKAAQIVNVCCALHNICIYFKSEPDFDIVPNLQVYNESNSDVTLLTNSEYMTDAQRLRRQIGYSL